MSELIDRRALIKQLKDENIPFNADINEIINIQPIAFDVANILEKLEEAEKKGSELIGKPHMDSHVLFGWGCAMKTAIEIVREEGSKNDRS